MAPDHRPLHRWGGPTVSAWSWVPVAAPHSPPRRSGPVRPPPRGSGSQRAATADADEPGPACSPPSSPPRPIRLRPIVRGHPPPTGRYFGDYVDFATPASLPTPASPPVSRRDGLMRARLCPVHGVDLVPSPTSFPATRRDGLASELSLLGSRGGPHRTTQPHTICRRPVGGLGWVQLPRAAHLTRSCARQDGLPYYLQHPGHHGRRKFHASLVIMIGYDV